MLRSKDIEFYVCYNLKYVSNEILSYMFEVTLKVSRFLLALKNVISPTLTKMIETVLKVE